MLRIIPLLIMFSALAGTSYYLSYRLYQGLLSFFQGIRFWPVFTVVIILVLMLILGFVRALTPFSTGVKLALGTVSSYCMGILLYLLLFTVAADLLLLVPKLLKLSFTTHHLFKGFVTLSVLLLTGITCVYGFFNARHIDHVSYDIQLPTTKTQDFM